MPKTKKPPLPSPQSFLGLIQCDENIYRTILQTSLDGFWINDSSGRLLDVNEALCRMLQYSRNELLQMTIQEIEASESPTEIAAHIRTVTESGHGRFQSRHRRKDGAIIDVEISVQHVPTLEDLLIVFARDITERLSAERAGKRAEDALRKSEETYRSILNAVPDDITITDLKGRILMVSPAALTMFGGNSEDDWLGHSVTEFLIPEDRERAMSNVGRMLHGVMAGPSEYRGLRTDGKVFDIEVNTEFVRDVDGRPTSMVIVVRDITKRKQIEEELRASEKKFRLLIDTASESIIVVQDGELKFFNIRTLDLLAGYSEQDLMNRPFPEFIHPDDRNMVVDKYRRRIAREASLPRYAFRVVTRDGVVKWVELNAAIMEWQGQPATLNVLTDITDRLAAEQAGKRAEEAVLKSKKQYDKLASNIPIGIYLLHTKPDGSIAFDYVSPKLAEMLDLSVETILADPRLMFRSLHADDLDSLVKLHHERFRQPQPVVWEGRFFVKGATKWLRIASVPELQDDGSFSWHGVVTDITDLNRTEEALRLSQKMESIGTLAGGIAHDFNNLLNAILGQMSLAIGKLAPGSSAVSNLTKATKAAERAADLTRQLLAYSGKGKFLVEEIDINLIASEYIQMLETCVPKTAQIRLELGSPSPCVKGDVGQIQQVIMNLVINAGEAMGPNPGYITLRTNRIQLSLSDTEYWKYTATPLSPGAYALIHVSDNGCGMSQEMLSRIFDPFFTTKFTGRGLGLAAVLGIVRGHHGGIRIQSEEGKGTQFEVVFPIVESAAPKAQEAHDAGVVNGNGKTVLLIDDDPSVLELLTDIFTEAKYAVISALNPREAIELYRQHQNTIVAVILDYSMPGMDGKATYEELVKIDKEVRVLLCSGYTEDETSAAFGSLRPSGFIQKPYRPAEILERVSTMISAKG